MKSDTPANPQPSKLRPNGLDPDQPPMVFTRCSLRTRPMTPTPTRTTVRPRIDTPLDAADSVQR